VRIVASGVAALLLCGSVGAAEIHTAARAGDLEAVKALLAADPALVNAQDANGATPLHLAARGVHAELVDYLVDHGADVTIRDANQVIALHSLAYRGADELVTLVITKGADVDAAAVGGTTPLHFAVEAGHVRTVERLVSHGANVEAANGLGNTPLLLAASFGLNEIVERLLARGASVGPPNDRGDTPLTVAHREGHDEIAKLLIAKGADPTQVEEIRLPEGPYLGQEPPGETAVLFAPRFVSTERNQLNAVFSPDGREFYFTELRPGGSAIMVTKVEDGFWSRPTPLGFSGPYTDVDHFMTRDGQRMYFCSNRPLTPGAETNPNADIWVTTRTEQGWGPPRHLGPTVNSEAGDYYPSFADDGTLYLSSRRPDALGDSDIYRASQVDGELLPPENLGPPVNTRDSEYDPFVAPDHSFLVFSSSRPGGRGESDLYISFRGAAGAWTEPRNMGPGVNSESRDFTPMLSPDGNYLFFTSRRAGVGDIYWVDARVIETLRE
jgi:ankyrin repeat protein